MNKMSLQLNEKLFFLLVSLFFCQSLSATVISTAVTAEAYTVSYPEPDNGWREQDEGMEYASVLNRSLIYDTGVESFAYVDANAQFGTLLSMNKHKASAASGSATINYQLENDSSLAQQFNLRFSPLFGYLQAYCADPEDMFEDGSGSRLPCAAGDFATASYAAQILLNDELIWSSTARVHSDSIGVDVITEGEVLGVFDADTYSYRWDTQWFDLSLGVFEPNEQLNLVYSVSVLTDGKASLEGATNCEPYNCPYPDNTAYAEYGSWENFDYTKNVFQFSTSSISVNEPINVGLLGLSALLLIRLKRNY
ncbi:hypothetical protein [Pseudoalteromonas atlantica]|uniref:hypothetical protein n=1 Tax=Pseudoalteromonas atlantica TaxID=288 RepID=UPI003A96FC43